MQTPVRSVRSVRRVLAPIFVVVPAEDTFRGMRTPLARLRQYARYNASIRGKARKRKYRLRRGNRIEARARRLHSAERWIMDRVMSSPDPRAELQRLIDEVAGE